MKTFPGKDLQRFNADLYCEGGNSCYTLLLALNLTVLSSRLPLVWNEPQRMEPKSGSTGSEGLIFSQTLWDQDFMLCLSYSPAQWITQQMTQATEHLAQGKCCSFFLGDSTHIKSRGVPSMAGRVPACHFLLESLKWVFPRYLSEALFLLQRRS